MKGKLDAIARMLDWSFITGYTYLHTSTYRTRPRGAIRPGNHDVITIFRPKHCPGKEEIRSVTLLTSETNNFNTQGYKTGPLSERKKKKRKKKTKEAIEE